MRKVSFPFTVRYGRVKYPAGTPVEVEDNEIGEMLAMGAREIVFEDSAKPTEVSVPDESVMAEATEKATKRPGRKPRTEPVATEGAADAVKNLDGQDNLFEPQAKPKRTRKPKE